MEPSNQHTQNGTESTGTQHQQEKTSSPATEETKVILDQVMTFLNIDKENKSVFVRILLLIAGFAGGIFVNHYFVTKKKEKENEELRQQIKEQQAAISELQKQMEKQKQVAASTQEIPIGKYDFDKADPYFPRNTKPRGYSYLD